MRYRFFADSNQRLFEDALAQAGLPAVAPERFVLDVADPPEWLEDLARDLGAQEDRT
jgi:hypothetical protein